MKKQKIGRVLFWIGVSGMLAYFFSDCFLVKVYRENTPESLIGTGWAPYERFFLIISLAMLIGFSFSLIGVLLHSGKKKSFFWLWALVPIVVMNIGRVWNPSQHIHAVYGIGAAVITLAYLGVLWISLKSSNAYEGIAGIGKHIQLLGYSFIYLTALFLCGYIGDPHLAGTGYKSSVSSYSILISFSIGWILLFAGNYLSAKQILNKN